MQCAGFRREETRDVALPGQAAVRRADCSQPPGERWNVLTAVRLQITTILVTSQLEGSMQVGIRDPKSKLSRLIEVALEGST